MISRFRVNLNRSMRDLNRSIVRRPERRSAPRSSNAAATPRAAMRMSQRTLIDRSAVVARNGGRSFTQRISDGAMHAAAEHVAPPGA